jgi:hypothetical protein
MSLNVERARELFLALNDEDPHAEARSNLISTEADKTPTRSHAIALLCAELQRDPHGLITEPPDWLLDLWRQPQPGTTLLFDSRLTDLSARAVDHLVAEEVSAEAIIDWLEDRRRMARPDH